jgi:hypothetical protein
MNLPPPKPSMFLKNYLHKNKQDFVKQKQHIYAVRNYFIRGKQWHSQANT